MSEWLDMRRLDGICSALGISYEDITVEHMINAPNGYGYVAWIKDYEPGCKVGTGRTPEAAIEDLLDQLS